MINWLLIGFLTFSATAAFSASGDSYDKRVSRHQSRLAGLDLDSRTMAVSTDRDRTNLAASTDDYLISGSVSPARFSQDNARIVSLADNGWLAAFNDDRSGAEKIYWQRFDPDGNPTGSNQFVAGSSVGEDFVDPELKRDTLGRIYLFYRNQTQGLIFGSRYNADLTVDLSDFLINDTSFASFAGPYDMAVFPDGQIVATWENHSVLGSTIEMRLYSPSGASLLGPVTANSDGGSASHWVPSVAVQPGSGYLIAWEDYRNGQADIFARQFNGAGNPVGGDFTLVPPPNNAAAQLSPEVTFSSEDGYVIGWEDLRLGQEIFLQSVDPSLGLMGGNVRISSGDILKINSDLSLSVFADGKTLANWAAFGADNSILGVTLDSGLSAIGSPVVRNMNSTGGRWNPAADLNTDDNYALVWTEFTNNDADINFMIFDSLGSRLLENELTINDDQLGAPSTDPFIIAATNWWNLVCFTDRRFDAGDIFLRGIDNSGSTGDVEQRVNQDVGFNLQAEPSAAVSGSRALVVWNDSRAIDGLSGQRIFGRFASLQGALTGDEFLISDSTATVVKSCPKAVMNGAGRGLVIWIDRRDGTAQIWGRWLATDGSLDGDEFAISNPANDLSATDLHIGLDASDHFYAIWLDIGVAPTAIKAVWYNSDGSSGGSFSVKSSLSGVTVNELAADVDPGGNVIALWSGFETGTSKLFLSEFAPDGATVRAPFEITDNAAANVTDPDVSVSPNGYVSAVWVDRRDGRRAVYYQILDGTRSPINVNQPVSSAMPEFMQAPSTDAFLGRAWFAWSDPRENGLNIFAGKTIYLPTDVSGGDTPTLPNGYNLAQNYPNPFNPTTVISFSLPSQSEITLTVINLLGQEVTTLASGMFPAGEHSVVWDGRDMTGNRVASSVYLYKLTTPEFIYSRKMMMLK